MIHFHSTNSVLIIGFYIRYDLYIPLYIRLLQNSASLWFVCKERQRYISILPMFSPLYKMGNQYSSLAHMSNFKFFVRRNLNVYTRHL